MKRVITVVLLLLGGCISHRAPLAWQTVDMKNTSKEPQIYTINIISANKIFSAELPFCVEYYGRWALISTLWYGGEQLAIDVNDSILRFPYAQANEWVVHSLPSLQFYGVLLVLADCPNEKEGLVCVARQGPGTNVPKLMASCDTLYEVPAIFPFHKDAKGNTTMVIRLVLWPGCTAKFKVNANCKLHITSIITDTALIATHETVLKNRK